MNLDLDSLFIELLTVHRELEVHTMYQRFLTRWQRQGSQQLDIRTNGMRLRFIKQLHPLAHAQFATFNSVQRLSPKKGASVKNSQLGLVRVNGA